jgi:hypothetical protein
MYLHLIDPDGQGHSIKPMRDLLVRVGIELNEIARSIDATQSLLSRLTWEKGKPDSKYVQAMQKADLHAQKLVGLSAFLAALAEDLPLDWSTDSGRAAKAVTLSDLAKRLTAQRFESSASDSPDSGDCDLF